MNLLHCIKECYERKQKLEHHDEHNPFKDVKFTATENNGEVFISITLDSSEKLNKIALQKVLAEMLATVLIEENLVEFSETTTTENNDILYTGRVEVVKPGSKICIN